LDYNYYAIDPLRYLLQRGDTLQFTYEGRLPSASLVNRPTLAMDLAYETEKRMIIVENANSEQPSAFDSLSLIGQYRAAPLFVFSKPPPPDTAAFKRQMEEVRGRYARLEGE